MGKALRDFNEFEKNVVVEEDSEDYDSYDSGMGGWGGKGDSRELGEGGVVGRIQGSWGEGGVGRIRGSMILCLLLWRVVEGGGGREEKFERKWERKE